MIQGDNMDMIKIGKTIKELRLSKGFSQGDVAKICNITAPAVSKWERGESIPDISSLECLSQLYGVTINEIINSSAVIVEAKEQTTNKYKILTIVLSILCIVLIGMNIKLYGDVNTDGLSPKDHQEEITEDVVLLELEAQMEQEYHLYFEATEHQFIQGNLNDWIFHIFIQEPELYHYFIDGNPPSLNDITVDTTTLVRMNNAISYIELDVIHNNEVITWKLDVTYYDIKSDNQFEDLNHMSYVASNNNEYQFEVFDDGYFVLYELVDGNTTFDNYYFHISDMKPVIIDENIRFDFELDKIGMNVIITDQFMEQKYHYIFPDYDGNKSRFFIQVVPDVYLSFYESGSELQLVNIVNDNGETSIFFRGYKDEVIVWDYENTLHHYLPYTINHTDLDYKITYSLQYSGLIHIVFERKTDGQIMSYYLQPNELEVN